MSIVSRRSSQSVDRRRGSGGSVIPRSCMADRLRSAIVAAYRPPLTRDWDATVSGSKSAMPSGNAESRGNVGLIGPRKMLAVLAL